MQIKIIEQAFDPLQEIKLYQSAVTSSFSGKLGAATIFIGTMRDFNEGNEVQSMVLEYYPGMTEAYLEKIADTAMQQWKILDVLIIHRVGELLPNEAIVLIAVWASHRHDAFNACRDMIEDLKSKAPFWKKEQLEQESRWVTSNNIQRIEDNLIR